MDKPQLFTYQSISVGNSLGLQPHETHTPIPPSEKWQLSISGSFLFSCHKVYNGAENRTNKMPSQLSHMFHTFQIGIVCLLHSTFRIFRTRVPTNSLASIYHFFLLSSNNFMSPVLSTSNELRCIQYT